MGRRWVVAAAVIAALLAAPVLWSLRPVASSPISATDLVSRIRTASARVPYVGEVDSRGGVGLPSDETLSSLAKLVGRDGTLRVWWESADRWRVSTIRPTGETDHYRAAGRDLRWVYESKRVTVSAAVPVRLPNTVDILPPRLAVWMLQGARPEELARIGVDRVAGRPAIGVRLTSADPATTLARVEVWADAASAVPLRVRVYARGASFAALDTRFSTFEPVAPDDAALRFTAPDDALVRRTQAIDVVAGADRYAGDTPLGDLAGYPRRIEDTSTVGVYGRGPASIMVLPVRRGAYGDLRTQIRQRPGATCSAGGWQVAEGPLSLLLPHTEVTGYPRLVVGTVDLDTLRRAAQDLPRFPVIGGVYPNTPGLGEVCR